MIAIAPKLYSLIPASDDMTYTNRLCNGPRRYRAGQPFQCPHHSSTRLGCEIVSQCEKNAGINLRSREATGGPAIGSVVRAEEGVLLFEAKPRLVVGVGVHDLHTIVAEVELIGGAIGVPALSQNDNVGRAAERIRVDSTGAEVDVGVLARGLVGRRTIKVPDGKIFGLVFLLG